MTSPLDDYSSIAFREGVVEPELAMLESRPISLLSGPIRAIKFCLEQQFDALNTFVDATRDPAYSHDCTSILAVAEDVMLAAIGQAVGFFTPAVLPAALTSQENGTTTRASSRHTQRALATVWAAVVQLGTDTQLSYDEFDQLLPLAREYRTDEAKECVRLLMFASESEWSAKLAQVDWFITELAENYALQLSTRQVDSLAWALSGVDDLLFAPRSIETYTPLSLTWAQTNDRSISRIEQITERRNELIRLIGDLPEESIGTPRSPMPHHDGPGFAKSRRYVPANAGKDLRTPALPGQGATARPNILVIWGDDIGITNLSCYSDGLMGYRTPNIDRIANEGMLFTDSYGEQSCTAGRASFITGQSVYRTGLSKVGMPGVDVGLPAEDPTIAELLKPLGYATGQFGKNHLGDMNKYLPSVHGFDEFFGNLYHLNAEEEPENPDYPTEEEAPLLRRALLPRGVIHSWATDEDSGEVDERYGAVGKQRIEDTGPLTKKRMETIDDETTTACGDFIRRQHEAGTPFFVWMNMTHMHFRTHTKPESLGQAGRWQSPYHDTMIDHDRNVGQLLDLVDELGIAEDTIVIYSTDNGPHANSWPDGATTPFRGEKATNWEGAFRVPELIRWPGKIPAAVVSNEIVQHHDWLPTFLAAAGDPGIVDKLKAGHTIGDMTYKVHIDGYNLMPYLTGEADKSPRRGMIYFSDDCDVLGVRFDNWKIVFMEQRREGTLQIWFEPFTRLRAPKLFNLRTDPFERADITSNTYWDWFMSRDFLAFYGMAIVMQFLGTFKEFPPRSAPASFTIDHAVNELNKFLAKH